MCQLKRLVVKDDHDKLYLNEDDFTVEQKTLWTNKYFVTLMAVIACILWGSAFPVLKVTYAELQLEANDISSRLLLAGGRFFLASLMLFLFLGLVFRQPLSIKRQWVAPLFLLGLTQTGLQYFFFYNGLAYTGGIKGAILNSIGNFFVVIFAHFLYQNDRLNFGKIIGLVTGFAGIVLINWKPGSTGLSWDLSFRGEGFLILAGLTSAIGTFQAKKLSRNLNPVLINGYQLLFGSLLLLTAGLPRAFNNNLHTTPLFWWLFVYSAFLSAAAFSIWYTLLKYNKAGEVTLYRFIIPVSGAILSATFLPNESLTPSVIIALILVAFGISAVNFSKQE